MVIPSVTLSTIRCASKVCLAYANAREIDVLHACSGEGGVANSYSGKIHVIEDCAGEPDIGESRAGDVGVVGLDPLPGPLEFHRLIRVHHRSLPRLRIARCSTPLRPLRILGRL